MSVDDPVAYFLEDMTYHGKADRTKAAYGRVLRDFEAFLEDRSTSIDSAERRDCLAWVHQIREEQAPSTVATYAAYLNRFYGYMNQVGVIESNPMTLVMEELPESVDRDPSRREISVSEMRSFVSTIQHPLDRAVIMTFLKTGIRVGELCNLDLRDLTVTEDDLTDTYDIIGERANTRESTLFIASDIAQGDTVNGETRTAANKRVRDTQIPVDSDLLKAIKPWLAIRPNTDSSALFVSTRDQWGNRLTPEMARSIVTDHARNRGWYESGGTAAENVTPHYFRHFFTTHLRDRTGDRGIVKYLRGDAADDIIDTYTHNWGNQVREIYEQSIYRFLDRSESN